MEQESEIRARITKTIKKKNTVKIKKTKKPKPRDKMIKRKKSNGERKKEQKKSGVRVSKSKKRARQHESRDFSPVSTCKSQTVTYSLSGVHLRNGKRTRRDRNKQKNGGEATFEEDKIERSQKQRRASFCSLSSVLRLQGMLRKLEKNWEAVN